MITVLLILSALGLLFSGLVYLSVEEVWIVRSTEELLRARLAAESAIRSEMARWESDEYHELDIGEIRQLEGGASNSGEVGTTTITTIERLELSRFLLRAQSATPGGAMATAASVIRTIDALEIWRDLPAALATTGPITTWGTDALVGFTPQDDDDAEPDCLAGTISMMAAALGDVERPPVHRLPLERSEELRFGPLSMSALQHAAYWIETGTATFRHHEAETGCESSATGNPGAPRQVASHCIASFPLSFAPAGLQLVGGQGRGILVVKGDLTLASGAEFHGIVLVEGRLRITGGSHIYGAAIVVGTGADTTIEDESSIQYEPCTLDAVVEGSSLIDSAYLPGDRSWIPGF